MAKIRLPAIHLMILLGVFFLAASAAGAPSANLWPRWENFDQSSSTVIDHGDWDRILQLYVSTGHPSGINRFRYRDVSGKDRLALEAYLQKMQSVKISALNRSEQKAFWINLYNALTVNIILEHYPVKSIREIDISPGIFSDGPWDAKLLKIEEQQLSLNDIEHRILRPIWRDNRVHYAVNCASLGCPDLQPQAYTSKNLEQMLEKDAQNFVNHPRGVSFASNGLIVSSIYFWFQSDFGDSQKGIIEHVRKYLSPGNLNKLSTLRNISIKHQYDWSLNE